jgi:hypothetical protein
MNGFWVGLNNIDDNPKTMNGYTWADGIATTNPPFSAANAAYATSRNCVQMQSPGGNLLEDDCTLTKNFMC